MPNPVHPVVPQQAPSVSNYDKIHGALNDPALHLALYGTLTAAELHAAKKDREAGQSGAIPLAAAGALGVMGAPHAMEAYTKYKPKIQSAFGSVKNRLSPLFKPGV